MGCEYDLKICLAGFFLEKFKELLLRSGVERCVQFVNEKDCPGKIIPKILLELF